MNQYIVTADDFGLSKSTNDAILEGIQKDVISSTNVMVNMPYASEAKHIINIDDIDVGIHLNLTTGVPLSEPSMIPTLVDDDERFYNFTEFKNRVKKGLIEKKDIIKEINSQYKFYISELGVPRYWNTHNHIQMIPQLFDLFVDCSKRYNVTVMRNNYKINLDGNSFEDTIKNIIIKKMYTHAVKSGISFPDGLICFRKRDNKFKIRSYIDNLCYGCGEIMIHVTKKIDSDMFGNMRENRIQEYDFFVNGDFATEVLNGNIKIKSMK